MTSICICVFSLQFSKCQLMDIYSKFIGNFMRAKAAMELAKQGRPVFAKFLEVKLCQVAVSSDENMEIL